jgi:hypothetical protein
MDLPDGHSPGVEKKEFIEGRPFHTLLGIPANAFMKQIEWV